MKSYSKPRTNTFNRDDNIKNLSNENFSNDQPSNVVRQPDLNYTPSSTPTKKQTFDATYDNEGNIEYVAPPYDHINYDKN